MSVKLPKVRFRDLDKKLVFLLLLLLLVTWATPFIPGIGEVIDLPEMIVDAIVAYLIGKRALAKAAQREGLLASAGLENEAAFDPTASTQPGVEQAPTRGRK